MMLSEKQISSLYWLRFCMIFQLFLVLFPIVFIWAYELEDYFGITFPSIIEFNEKELILFDGSFLLTELQNYIVSSLIFIIYLLIFFRYREGKYLLIPYILFTLLYSVEGLFDPMYFHPLFPLTNYIEGFFNGFIVYFCFFSPIKNIFVKSIIPKSQKIKK